MFNLNIFTASIWIKLLIIANIPIIESIAQNWHYSYSFFYCCLQLMLKLLLFLLLLLLFFFVAIFAYATK